MQQTITREFDFGIKVQGLKKKIDDLISSGSGQYIIEDRNDLFNTYRVKALHGALVCFINITLKKIEENKTQWSSIISSPVGNKIEQDTLVKIHDEFISNISNGESVREINPGYVKESKKGCLGIFVLLVLLAGVTAFTLLR